MATSAVPAAIDALLSVLSAAPSLSGVVVHDGFPGTDLEDDDLIVVGWSTEQDTAAEVRQDFAYAGARRRDEEFDVLCWLQSWAGDSDMRARRGRAFAMLAAVEDALRATDADPTAPTLGGAVQWSHLTAATFTQARGQNGPLAGISFRITCRARL